MKSFWNIIGAWSLKVLQWIAIIILGPPVAILALVIPRGAWPWIVRVALLILVYRYVYPKHDPIVDLFKVIDAGLKVSIGVPGEWKIVKTWLSDQQHIALITTVGGVLVFAYKEAKSRAKDKKLIREKLSKHIPNLTARFILTEDDGTICSLTNVGSGMAMAVQFRFYRLVDRTSDPDVSRHLMRRADGRHILMDDETRVWKIIHAVDFPYILPEGKRPREIPLGIVPTNPSYEIMVEVEYLDVDDNSHFQFAQGGQSADHTYMSLGVWHKTAHRRGERQSNVPGFIAYFGFHVARVMWRFDNVTSPLIQSELKIKTERAQRWLSRNRPEDADRAKDGGNFSLS